MFQIGKNFYGDFSDVATGLGRGFFWAVRCTCSRITSYPWIFDEALDDCGPPAVLLSRFGSCGHFLVPEVGILAKSRRFQTV